MDVRPDRTQDLGKRVEVFWEGDEVFYRGTVVGFNAKTNQHQILYDDNDVEKVNLRVCPMTLGSVHASASALQANGMVLHVCCMLVSMLGKGCTGCFSCMGQHAHFCSWL